MAKHLERGDFVGGKSAKVQSQRARPKYLDELIFDPDKGMLSAPNGNDIVVINRQTLGTVFEGM